MEGINVKYFKDKDGHHFAYENTPEDITGLTPLSEKEIKALRPSAEEKKKNHHQYEARQYLLATDFYVTRKLETGAAIPKAIRLKRDKARSVLATHLPDFNI